MVQQLGERRTDRLPSVALVVEKAWAGIDLKTIKLPLGRLLKVDAGEEEIERSRASLKQAASNIGGSGSART